MTNLQFRSSALILIIATVLFDKGKNLENKKNYDSFYNNAENVIENVINPNIIPLHYDIVMTLLDFENTSHNHFQVSGNGEIGIQIIHPITSFKLNVAPSMKITYGSLKERVITESFYKDIPKIITRSRENLASYEEWSFENSLVPGHYTLQFDYNYTAYDNEKGFFRTSYKDHKIDMEDNNIQWLLTINSWPNAAHRIFPCFELPGSRTTFQITIIYNNNKYKLLTNMKIEFETDILDTYKKRFETTPNITAYQLAFIICNFEINYVHSLADKIYSRNSDMHIKYTETLIAKVTSFLQKKWPVIKNVYNPIVYYALIPGFPRDSADGLRLVFLREDKAVYDQEMDTFGRKIAVTRFLAHKITYQWLGNIVNFDNWTNLWINDGIAIFYGMHAIDEIYPETQMLNLFVVQDVHEALLLDTFSFMQFRHSHHNNFNLDLSFYFVRYLKGPVLIHMLYHMMTSDYIQRGITKYLTSPSKPSTIEEFWRFLEEANKDNEQSNFKKTVKDVIDTWTKSNYPIINVQTNVDAEQKNIIVTVTQESNDFTDWNKWWILITWFTDQSIIYSNDITSSHMKWLSPDERSELPLTTLKNKNGWIIVNTKRSGYYRVSYNDENWRRIGQFLQTNVKSKSYQYSNQIHVLNRAQLIDDAFYFLKMNKLKVDQFLNLTKFLSQDTDYIAWYPMLKALEFISPVFALYNKKIEHLKLHFLSLLVPLLDQIGYDAKSNEDKLTECLREEAVKWACILGDIKCKNMATLKLLSHLRNCSTHKILPRWRKWTYCEGLKMGDKWIWHNVVHIWDEKRDDTLLQYLMCSEDYYIAIQSFRTLKDKNIVKNAQSRDDAIHFMFFLEKYANHTAVLKDILNDKFLVEKKPRAMTRTAALVIVINNIYTTVGLEKVENYTHPYEPFIMNSRILSKIIDRKNQIYKMTEYQPFSIFLNLL